LHLPAVVGMGLLNIDAIEINPVTELCRDFVQAHGLNTKGRSGVGAEDQTQRAALVVCQMLRKTDHFARALA